MAVNFHRNFFAVERDRGVIIRLLPLQIIRRIDISIAVRIGSHVLPNDLAVAPMAGVTDRPFRMLCKRLSARICGVRDGGVESAAVGHTEKSRRRIDHAGEIAPVAVQIAGADPADDGGGRALQRRSRRADHRHQHGLPGEEGVQRRRGVGAARQRAAGRGRSSQRSSRAVDVPVTLKIRTGPRSAIRATRSRIARIAEDAGIAALDRARPHARVRVRRRRRVRHDRRGQARGVDPGHRQRRHRHAGARARRAARTPAPTR